MCIRDRSYGYECPKPTEFGSIGSNWENVGWRVDVAYTVPATRIMPREHIHILGPLLPDRYAPLQQSGDGIQSVYLAEISRRMGEVLAALIGPEVQRLVSGADAAHRT